MKRVWSPYIRFSGGCSVFGAPTRHPSGRTRQPPRRTHYPFSSASAIHPRLRPYLPQPAVRKILCSGRLRVFLLRPATATESGPSSFLYDVCAIWESVVSIKLQTVSTTAVHLCPCGPSRAASQVFIWNGAAFLGQCFFLQLSVYYWGGYQLRHSITFVWN